MPFTLNGIGTHYYGGANRSARVDVCQFCNHSTTLSSYDTREWVCVLFIPIIPLRKYRILNDCSRCRRHQRIGNDQFAKKFAEVTSPIRQAISRSPNDPQPRIDLVRAMIGWEMRGDAERELRSATAAFPQNIDLMLLAAQLAVGRSDLKGALPIYEKAYGIDPQNPTATYGLGWVLHKLEQHERAITILQQAVSQGANKAGALYLLGTSQMKLSRWNEALNSFQQMLGLDAAFQRDKNLIRLMRECKQHLGYQLTDAERRAGRRWWPFGRKQKLPALQSQPTLVRPSLRYAGLAILAVLLLGAGIYVWDRWTNIALYVDNGLDRAVRIDLDDRHFAVARNTMHQEHLRSGAHTLIVRGNDQKEIERLAFRVDKLSLWDAMVHDRFFVYNVSALRIYRRGVHGYAKRREDATYSEELIGMQRWIEQRDVDYVFQGAPNEISVDSNSSNSTIHKISFDTARDVDLRNYALVRFAEGKTGEAVKAIDRAAALEPCDTRTRRTQLVIDGAKSIDTAAATARSWIADCAENDLEAHRAYQDINNENGRQEAMREEYRKLLDSSQSSGKAHYLYGRVLGDPAAAAVEYQEALRLDPTLSWARIALGHAYALMERYDDALREFSAALDMKGHDPSAVVYYATAAISKGTPAEALAKIEEMRKADPRDVGAREARWLLALSSSDWGTAAAMQKAFKSEESPATSLWRSVKLLRMEGDDSVDARIREVVASRDFHALGLQLRIERLIESGNFAQSAELIAGNAKELDPATAAMFQAYTAAGLMMSGKTADGETLLAGAETMLEHAQKGNGERVTRAIVEGLRGTMPVDAVLAATRESSTLSHGWFVAAVRAALAGDRAHQSEYFARSLRAASDFEFPYFEVKGLAKMSPGA